MLEQKVGMLFRRACRVPLLPVGERQGGPLIEGEAVEALLPHRGPFLFIDRITHVGRSPGAHALPAGEPVGKIVCRYDLIRAMPILSGHFPGRPLWPGVFQVEAVGQAGFCLFRLLSEEAVAEQPPACMLTDILAGRFLRPIVPDGEVEIVTQILRDGLFVIVVGQCLIHDQVCSAAAVRGIEKEASL